MEDKTKKATKGGAKWKEVVIGGVTGVSLGAGAAVLMGSRPASESTTEENVEPVESDTPEIVDNGYAQMASSVNDDMSFNEAFAAARAEVGAGGVFEWHGGIYGTYYASEWNAMDQAARDEFASTVPFHSSSHTGTTHSTTTTHNENVIETETETNVTTGTDNGSTIGGISVEGGDDEIEIIGVEHADLGFGHDSIIGGYSVNGQAVYLVDIDGEDDEFDVMMSDLNGNNSFEENEIFDITDQHMSVSHFEQLAEASTGSSEDNLDDLYADNTNLPDYVNDVDPGQLE